MATPTITWTPEMDQTLREKYYHENWPAQDIAILLGIRKKQVYNRVHRLKIKRQHGKRRRESQYTPSEVTHIITEYTQTDTPVHQIAKQLNKAEDKVWNKIISLKIKRRPEYQRQPRGKPQQNHDGRYIHQKPGEAKPHIDIHTSWDGNGTIKINLYNLLEAWNKDLDYTYHNLPQGVTVDVLDEKIQTGEWSLL